MSIAAAPQLIHVACALCGADDSRPDNTVAGFTLSRCRKCGFVYVNPRYAAADLEKLYTRKNSAQLIEHYNHMVSPVMLAQYHERIDLLERLMPTRGRLLDFACAAGHFFELAGQRGWDAHGADIGEWTREAAEARGLKNLHVGYLQDLGFPDHHFDVIHAAQVFEHLEHPGKLLAELRRILRPGGLLYVDVPNYHTLPIMLNRDDFFLNEPPQHINYFTPKTLRALLVRAGLVDVRILTTGGLKWENLVGKKSISDPAGSHGPPSTGPSQERRDSAPVVRKRSFKSMVKNTVMRGFVRPVLYNWSKLGMLLIGISRQPS